MKVDVSKIYSIVVTNQCNLNCRYCYVGGKSGLIMHKAVALRTCDFIIEDAIQNHISDVQISFELTEPLLNFKIIKLFVNKLKKKFSVSTGNKKTLTFSIFSNFTLIRNEVLDFIEKNNVYVTTSLDGPKEIHDFHRGKNFDTVVAMIEKIKQRKIPLKATAVITRFSIEHYQEIIDTYIKLGLRSISFTTLKKRGYGLTRWNKLGYSVSDLIDFQKKCLLYIIEKNFHKQIFIYSNFLQIFNLIRKDGKTAISPLLCNAFHQRLAFDVKGDIFTCCAGRVHRNHNRFKVGNVYAGIDYSKLKNFWKLFENVKLNSCKCKKCKIYGRCLPCLTQNFPLTEPNKDRCQELIAYFSLLNELLKKPKIYNLFMQWDNFTRESKYLYR